MAPLTKEISTDHSPMPTEHEWLCLTPGCPHRTPPKYATAGDAFAAAMHHVRHNGHRVQVTATSKMITTCELVDADDRSHDVL